MASKRRVAAPLLAVSRAGSVGEAEELLLSDQDVCARLAALAAELLRERLPELVARHALAGGRRAARRPLGGRGGRVVKPSLYARAKAEARRV